MEIKQIKNKFNFYIGFLHTFTNDAKHTLKDKHIHHLRLLREYLLESLKFLEEK